MIMSLFARPVGGGVLEKRLIGELGGGSGGQRGQLEDYEEEEEERPLLDAPSSSLLLAREALIRQQQQHPETDFLRTESRGGSSLRRLNLVYMGKLCIGVYPTWP